MVKIFRFYKGPKLKPAVVAELVRASISWHFNRPKGRGFELRIQLFLAFFFEREKCAWTRTRMRNCFRACPQTSIFGMRSYKFANVWRHKGKLQQLTSFSSLSLRVEALRSSKLCDREALNSWKLCESPPAYKIAQRVKIAQRDQDCPATSRLPSDIKIAQLQKDDGFCSNWSRSQVYCNCNCL